MKFPTTQICNMLTKVFLWFSSLKRGLAPLCAVAFCRLHLSCIFSSTAAGKWSWVQGVLTELQLLVVYMRMAKAAAAAAVEEAETDERRARSWMLPRAARGWFIMPGSNHKFHAHTHTRTPIVWVSCSLYLLCRRVGVCEIYGRGIESDRAESSSRRRCADALTNCLTVCLLAGQWFAWQLLHPGHPASSSLATEDSNKLARYVARVQFA